jgi:hypothetical protein
MFWSNDCQREIYSPLSMERSLTISQKRMLHRIASLANDSRKGYLVAVEHILSPTLKEIFLDYSTQRTSFSIELRKASSIQHIGQGTYAGIVHRAWMISKYTITKNEFAGVIHDCILSEKYFLKYILKAEKLNLPQEIAKIISTQKREIVQSIALLYATLEFLPSAAAGMAINR